MRQATVRSRCECQSTLVADLDEKKQVIRAYIVDKHGEREAAPGHSIAPDASHFDIGWLCPVCGRNTLRSFATEALVYVEVAGPPPPPPPPPGA